MRVLQLGALLVLVFMPSTQLVWLGRLNPKQLLGPWYLLAVASHEKGFMVEKNTKYVEGVMVTLTPENTLKVLSTRHGLEGCTQNAMELSRQSSRWVFENPALGVLQYRVLGTNFRDYAIVLTQMEIEEEAFNTLGLYSRMEMASQEALQLFTKWSRNLGFLSQQQAQLQKDCECPQVARGVTCARRILQVSHQLGGL
ncbi:epididymal-specific lipocalin-6 [Ictidomys tridecemlineatus]